ncbi:glypican-5 [Austrofundulus limnaeus]|uniref:Glypican-5 n=1 Tax=Austrofundulus limnaeus TaxID=52670 RepID=A0A2I4D5A8_AUSLI|nr:PREDICTED: glypican-5-like [Austrofundulus limnaeus]
MSRGKCPRVNSLDSVWILTLVTFAVTVMDGDAYSCREVKAAFQLRQVGPLHFVPETPYTDVDLLVCKHQGPSCCTRKMEENYLVAAKRETLNDILSYIYEPEHILSGHLDAFHDMFQYLLSLSQGHLSSLLEDSYSSLSRHALPHVNELFSSLSLYFRGANVSVEATVQRFFNNIFPFVYTRLINPDFEGSVTTGSVTGDCLRMIRQDVNPFGHHPAVMAQELAGALVAGRQLVIALKKGVEVMNATEHANLSRECVKNLMKMAFCSHCRGLTLIKPCVGYCLNVMRGCLASVSELDQPWRKYTHLLEQLTSAVAGHHNLKLATLGVRGHFDEALLYAQLHGPLITATVDKVCGLSTGEPKGMQPTSPEVTTSTITSSTPLPSAAPFQLLQEQNLRHFARIKGSFPLKPSKNNKHSLRTLSREFLLFLQRYKSFFAVLPEMLCEAEGTLEDSTCWSGDGVVERYTGRIVGNGLSAQRQNPELKVRSMDPLMAEVKESLECFNQETEEKFPKLDQIWDDLGSGEEDGSTTDCDDEDGCQSSGDGSKGKGEEVSPRWKPPEGQPGGGNTQENPSKPPSVKVIGGLPSSSWLQSGHLILLLVGLCVQLMLF